MTIQDRIKIYKLLGYEPVTDGMWNGAIRRREGEHFVGPITHIKEFNPYRSILDDYMVLKIVQNTWNKDGADWCSFWFELGSSASYKVGDWTRALLQVFK